MGKKSPSPPPAPDPVATAQAQGAMNKETAIANAELGMVNQYTPYGNLTYTPRGNSAAGTPQYESRIELSPQQQQLLNLTQQGDVGTAQLGVDQLGRISNAVSTPFSFSALPSYGEGDQNAAALRAEEALMSRLNPQFQRDEEALRSRLINQGIGQNTEAYNREFERFNQAKNDARTQAILQGQNYGSRELADALTRRNQGIQEYTTTRNAPLNEYSALVSGTQIQNPQFQSSQPGGINPVNYAQMVDNQYQSQLGAYNAKVAGNNATTTGLFNLGAAAIPLFKSDIRVKQNIKYIGIHKGHKLYEFAYISNPLKRFIGVIAQEIEKYMPEAVHTLPNGIKAVNYDMLGLNMEAV